MHALKVACLTAILGSSSVAGAQTAAALGPVLGSGGTAAEDAASSGVSMGRAGDEPALQVTVRGRLLRQASDAPISASTVVTEEELSAPGRSSADVLRAVPGVQVARSGASSDIATASLRGATSAQTPIYLAGIRLNDDLGGGADLSATPLWIVDRVEIYRGNAPERADRLGIGGAIVFYPRLPKTPEFRLGAEVGSFGERAQWTVATVGTDKSAALVGLKLSAAANDYTYEDDRGTAFDSADDVELRRRNADYSSVDLWALGRQRLGSTTVRTVFNGWKREQGINGFSVSPALHARATQQRLLSGVSVDGACGADPKCRYELSSQALVAHSLTVDPRREIAALLTKQLDVAGLRLSQRAALEYAAAEELRLSGSLQYAWERTELSRLGTKALSATRTTLRPTLSAYYSPSLLRTYGLVALECHGTASSESGEQTDFCGSPELVGRLGIQKPLSDEVAVLLTGGRYVRIPTVGEQFGTSPVVRGNDELEVERSWGLEVGLRAEHCWDQVSVQGEVFGFARWTDDLIGYRLASLGIVRPLNIGRARTLGVESAAGLDAWNHIRLKGNATLLDPRDQSDDHNLKNDLLPYQSRLVLSIGAELYGDIARLGLHNAHLALDYFRRAARFADAAGLIVLPAEETVDVRSGVGLGESKLRLAVTLRNAFDRRNQDLFGAPLPGRSAHLALEGVIDP